MEQMYLPAHTDKFKNHIISILQLSKLKQKHIDTILNHDGLELYSQAYTHPSVNPDINYECLEILGDSTLNQCIVWYLNRRFPQLRNPKGVKVIARLKINLVSKQTFFEIGKKIGLWEFIRADIPTRETKMKPSIEDVFEAFIGVTQTLLDNLKFGLGNMICYKIVESLFDDIEISLKYTDLYDPITRLKETVDCFRQHIGSIEYVDKKDEERRLVTSVVYRVRYHSPRKCFNCGQSSRDVISKEKIGTGVAALKKDARQRASEVALSTLLKMGFNKETDPYYAEIV